MDFFQLAHQVRTIESTIEFLFETEMLSVSLRAP